MGILIGATGLVGSQILNNHDFELKVHRPTLRRIENLSTDLLICAGLPAEKWRANKFGEEDWENIETIVCSLKKVKAQKSILISTIDVFQPAINVFEDDDVSVNGPEPYGNNRAKFEKIFRSIFDQTLTVRLPALFSPRLKKNFVFDLMNSKTEHFSQVNPMSEFQFFDLTKIWSVIQRALELDIEILNVSSVPIRADRIARLFGVKLDGVQNPIKYDMRTKFAVDFGGLNGYMFSSEEILQGIEKLRETKF